MKELIEKIAGILYEKKAQNIVALDVSGMTVITDEVEDRLSELGIEPARKEGQQEGRWIVLDYGSVLVHIFHAEEREFYRLDKLWEADQNRIALPFDNEVE